MKARTARVERKTKETQITLSIDLDGSGQFSGVSGVGFFDHMLGHIARQSQADIELSCSGDLEIDSHHTIEDVGICLGTCIAEALGDKAGINRYGSAYVPMDECLARAVIDLSGRSAFVWEAPIDTELVGQFPVEMAPEFFDKVAMHARMNLHIDLLRGTNAHHGLEAIFKGFGRALRQAVELDPRSEGVVPTTKGVL